MQHQTPQSRIPAATLGRIIFFPFCFCFSLLVFGLGLGLLPAHASPAPAVSDRSTNARQADIQRRGTLYLVRDRQHGHTAYLFGTVHVGQNAFYPLEPQVSAALDRADKLVLEVDIRNAEALQQAFVQYGMYPDDQTIAQHVSTDTLAKLKQALQATGVPYDNVARMKPWMIANLLLIKELELHGYPTDQGIEMYFLSLAKQQNKSVGQLETADYQLSLFDSMAPAQQEAYLRESITELADGSTLKKSLALLTAWRNADSKAILRSFHEMQNDKSATSSFEKKVLIDERNPGMANKIEVLLRQDKASFVAIGAFHLLGKKGVPALLQQRGYEVRKLY